MTHYQPTPRFNPPLGGPQHPHSAARFFELSLDLLCIASPDGFLRRINPAFRRLLGWSDQELLSRTFFDFIHPDDVVATQLEMSKLKSGVSILSFEHRLLRKNGRERVILWTAHPDMEAGVFYAVGRDITARKQLESDLNRRTLELEQANERLGKLATTDELTQLPNRRALKQRFDEEAQREQTLALLLVDIDHFKRFNDRYGHTTGDAVLRQAGQLLKQSVRSMDCPSRFGGEEFAVILPGADVERARESAHRIVQAFRSHPWPDAPVTVSIGMASIRVARQTNAAGCWKSLLEAADTALYRAKHCGRDQVQTQHPPAHSMADGADQIGQTNR